MSLRFRHITLLWLLAAALVLPAHASGSASCDGSPFSTLVQAKWSQAKREQALQMMLDGSSRVSRTVKNGRRFLAPAEIKDADVTTIAEQNFREAARYVVENFEKLPVNQDTAIRLNMMLTEKLVPEEDRGNFLFRLHGTYAPDTDDFVGGNPNNFYSWLDSPMAQELQKSNPVEFAEKLHYNLAALDSFPDGNGRLSRLFADLALLRAGMPPAYYTDMDDYFARGTVRSPVTRKQVAEYFREIVKRGREAMKTSTEPVIPLRPAAHP
jgi:Fic family protein